MADIYPGVMLRMSTQGRPAVRSDRYSGAQQDVVVRGSGFLSILGAASVLVLAPFFPPTAQLGTVGWFVLVPATLASLGLGVLHVKLRRRPSMAALRFSSFTGVLEIGLVQWLAGGGRAPYVQLLLLPLFGAGTGQPVAVCAQVSVLAMAAALSPALYSSVDLATSIVEFSLLSVMTLMTAVVIASTRAHRAQLQEAGDRANVLAHLDALTGMGNRLAFDEALAATLEASERKGSPVALLLCDVDSFKQINDRFGHPGGDEVLRCIAHTLTSSVRAPDLAFRWAGDEFAVILRDSDEAGAAAVAARLQEAVWQGCRRPDGRPVSIGVGVAVRAPGMTAEDLLRASDQGLLSEKARRSQLRSAGSLTQSSLR